MTSTISLENILKFFLYGQLLDLSTIMNKLIIKAVILTFSYFNKLYLKQIRFIFWFSLKSCY